MKKILCILIGACLVVGAATATVFAAEKVLAGFEQDTQGLEIPDWAMEKEDYVGDSLALSQKYAVEGKSSLEFKVDFPGAKWTGAYVEIVEYFDWTPYAQVSADVYLPPDAPIGLKAKFIATVGEGWEWTEMARGFALEPGKWTTITAHMKPGSTDWRRTTVTDAFRQDVRKLGIRIESNMKPAYKGSIYIDNVRLIE
jgi:hypothetical protein